MPPKLRPVKKQISLTARPPQHAYENDPNHRSFLSRSLNKSDVELCAIMKLNDSLNKLKECIVNEFGDDVLLDVGEGKITLRKCGESEGDGGTIQKNGGSEEVVFVNTDVDRVGMELGNSAHGSGSDEENEKDMDDADVKAEGETEGESVDGNSEDSNDEENEDDVKDISGTKKEDNSGDDGDGNDDGDDDDDDDVEMKEVNESSTTTDPEQNENLNDQNKNDDSVVKSKTDKNPTPPTNPEEIKYQTLIKTNPTFTPVIKSFILRLKLRRKLLNRLSRRLVRLSYAMDGKLHKINPPMLPKYGTSFEKHSHNVKDKVNEWNMDFESRKDVLQKVWRKKDAWNRVVAEERQKKREIEKDKEVKESEKCEYVKEEDGEDKEKANTDVKSKNKSVSNDMDDDEAKKKNDDGMIETAKVAEEAKDEIKKDDDTSNNKANEDQVKEEETEKAANDTVKKEGNENNNDQDVEMKDVSIDKPKEEDQTKPKHEEESSAATATATKESSKKVSIEESKKNDQGKRPDPPTDEEPLSEEEPTISIKAENDTDAKAAVAEISKVSSSPFDFDPFLLDSEHQKNLEKLIEHDIDYAKKHTVHIPTSTILRSTTALTKDELAALDKDEDDFDDTSGTGIDAGKNMNHGIGAVSKFMTKKEKVMEWKRWQAEFLSKIPDQPTFEDLTNRVFKLDERRKLSQKMKEEKKDDGVKSGETDNDGDKDKSLKRKRESRSENDESNNDKASDDEDSSDEEKADVKKITDVEASLMKQKRICLDPVPSFHQQDYSRILMIQSATLSAALSNTSRETYLQAKNEYDQIFKRSHAIQQQKNDVEKELHKILYEFRMKMSTINQSIAIAKVKWETEKKAFETQRIQNMQITTQLTGTVPSPGVVEAMTMSDDNLVKRSLAAAVDRVLIRTAPKEHASDTPYLTSTLRRLTPNSGAEQVTTTLAHCVDVVAKRVKSGWLTDAVIDEGKGGGQFPPFVPPVSSNPDRVIMNARGETYTQLENRLKAEISNLKTQLDVSEASRSKAWSRLNKAKAAYNNRANTGGASTQSTNKAHRPKTKTNTTSSRYANNANVVQRYTAAQQRQAQPQPRVTAAASYQTPAAMASNPAVASAAAAAAAVKANMNIGNPSSMTQGGASGNKYSIEKVRARMYSDGSVLPVSEPKRGKDGLFLRPAGRQRKGMDWDGVNGKWVPQGSLRR